jgi:hypothetical protein
LHASFRDVSVTVIESQKKTIVDTPQPKSTNSQSETPKNIPAVPSFYKVKISGETFFVSIDETSDCNIFPKKLFSKPGTKELKYFALEKGKVVKSEVEYEGVFAAHIAANENQTNAFFYYKEISEDHVVLKEATAKKLKLIN